MTRSACQAHGQEIANEELEGVTVETPWICKARRGEIGFLENRSRPFIVEE